MIKQSVRSGGWLAVVLAGCSATVIGSDPGDGSTTANADAGGTDGTDSTHGTNDTGTHPQPILSCSPLTEPVTVGAVQVDHLTVGGSMQYFLGRDANGFYAISAVAASDGCVAECTSTADGFVDPCHNGQWNVDGTQRGGLTGGDLPHLALHFTGSGASAVVVVSESPNEVVVPASTRFTPPM